MREKNQRICCPYLSHGYAILEDFTDQTGHLVLLDKSGIRLDLSKSLEPTSSNPKKRYLLTLDADEKTITVPPNLAGHMQNPYEVLAVRGLRDLALGVHGSQTRLSTIVIIREPCILASVPLERFFYSSACRRRAPL